MVVLLPLLASCGEGGACSGPTTTTPPTTTTTTPPTTTTTPPPTTTTPPTTTPDVTAGAELYLQNCAICHGVEREGTFGPTLIGHGLTDEELETIIREGGREGTAMPPWKNVFTAEEIGDLVAYLSEE